jgi:hypothetical protein
MLPAARLSLGVRGRAPDESPFPPQALAEKRRDLAKIGSNRNPAGIELREINHPGGGWPEGRQACPPAPTANDQAPAPSVRRAALARISPRFPGQTRCACGPGPTGMSRFFLPTTRRRPRCVRIDRSILASCRRHRAQRDPVAPLPFPRGRFGAEARPARPNAVRGRRAGFFHGSAANWIHATPRPGRRAMLAVRFLPAVPANASAP